MPGKQFETPAPGEYDIDRLEKSKLQSSGCVRGYTFGHPNMEYHINRTPGNKELKAIKSKLKVVLNHISIEKKYKNAENCLKSIF